MQTMSTHKLIRLKSISLFNNYFRNCSLLDYTKFVVNKLFFSFFLLGSISNFEFVFDCVVGAKSVFKIKILIQTSKLRFTQTRFIVFFVLFSIFNGRDVGERSTLCLSIHCLLNCLHVSVRLLGTHATTTGMVIFML